MNNIKSFNEYTHQELEVIAYDNVLNEGLRSFFNKRAAAKVRSELSDEIEMDGFFVMIPDMESYAKILRALGIPVEE